MNLPRTPPGDRDHENWEQQNNGQNNAETVQLRELVQQNEDLQRRLAAFEQPQQNIPLQLNESQLQNVQNDLPGNNPNIAVHSGTFF